MHAETNWEGPKVHCSLLLRRRCVSIANGMEYQLRERVWARLDGLEVD